MKPQQPQPKTPPIPNNKEKPDLIFGDPAPGETRLSRAKRYFKEGPLIPLNYYNDETSGEMKARSEEVMQVIRAAYYSTLGGGN